MKTVLVPTEKSDLMNSTLETALLFAKRFDSYIEGFALRAAISDFVAADLIVADAWAVAETRDAELAKEARTLFETFMQTPRRAAGGAPAAADCRTAGPRPTPRATLSSAATAACSTSSCSAARARIRPAPAWRRWKRRCSRADGRS